MVPIYAADSWFSIMFYNYSLYFDLPRDMYEAYVIYQFFVLLVAFLGEEDALIANLEDKTRRNHPIPLCCLTFKPGGSFFRLCKRMILQFVLLKPIITAIAIGLNIFGYYDDGSFSTKRGYLYLTIIDNLSIGFSLYYLVLFYIAVQEELEQFKPIPKFLAIKAVVFFTFWQGVLIAILSYSTLITTIGSWSAENTSTSLQDFIICLEMFIIAVAHHWIFPFKNFRDPTKTAFLKDFARNAKPLVRNFGDVLLPTDVLDDTAKAFDPKKGIEIIHKKITRVITSKDADKMDNSEVLNINIDTQIKTTTEKTPLLSSM